MKQPVTMLILAALAIGLSACAAGPVEPQSLTDKLAARNYIFGEKVERINNYRINGWSEIDSRHVIINAGVRDKYLLVLRNSCMNLSSATRIAFTSTAGSLTDFDKIMVSGPGSFVDHCYIQDIYLVKSIESKEPGR